MSVALLMSLALVTISPEPLAQSQPQAAPAAADSQARPERAPRARTREAATNCQFRARTGSIYRRNICTSDRQAEAQRAAAQRYVEEIQMPPSRDELPGGGPR